MKEIIMHHKSKVFPFTAIVGQELMKTALILNAINPKIGGVLIKGEKGTAKSTAARSLTELLPKIEVVSDCPFYCDPKNVQKMCSECTERFNSGEELPSKQQYMKMVTLPVSATEDRVVGTINLKKALEDKELALEPGILAEVNRGILYIDEVNLLDNHVADLLLDAAAMGYNIIERENISFFHPSNFILIGTMNPEEGDLRPQLLDRFGLCIEVQGEKDLKKRIQIIKIRQEFDSNPKIIKQKFEIKQQKLRNKIINAKKILPKVKLPEDYFEFISLICIEFGVDGHRADITIAKTARTIAAFEGRRNVNFKDLKKAMILSLPHRLRKGPFMQKKFDIEEFNEFVENLKREFDEKKGNNSQEQLEETQSTKNAEQEQKIESKMENEEESFPPENIDDISEDFEVLSDSQDLNKDIDNIDMSDDTNEINVSMQEISLEERILENYNPENHNEDFYNSEEVIFEVGDGITDQARKDILKQKLMLVQQKTKSRKGINQSINKTGRYSRFRAAKKDEKINDIAIDATFRSALIDSIKNNEDFNIKPHNYKIKVRKSPTNILIIFLLDTSSSMAAHKRMSAAKGALLSLLETIYIRKDKIALITFSNNEANLVIPPTNSVELASEILPEIPTGGKTPLSKAIKKAINIAVSEQNVRGIIPLLICLSDCKQNVSLASLNEDLEMINQKLENHGIPLIIIDTDLKDYNLGFAKEVSEKLNAIYYQLEKLQGDKIANIVATEYKDMTKMLDRL
ncbi:MAG: VWA domain-containing protein [Candidatus Lokiarchaeota archaeon]|nr:VWA domain-containing protein [Candidatus Lokiarchaeota archaeon]